MPEEGRCDETTEDPASPRLLGRWDPRSGMARDSLRSGNAESSEKASPSGPNNVKRGRAAGEMRIPAVCSAGMFVEARSGERGGLIDAL